MLNKSTVSRSIIRPKDKPVLEVTVLLRRDYGDPTKPHAKIWEGQGSFF